MFATLGQMLSPRSFAGDDGALPQASPRSAKPRTMRDFGAMLPKPQQSTSQQSMQSPATSFRSPRGLEQRSPRGMPTALPGAVSVQQRARRASAGVAGYPGAALAAEAPPYASCDGRDGYDVWHGVHQSERRRTARKSIGGICNDHSAASAASSASAASGSSRKPRSSLPEGSRDGFEMFFGISEPAGRGGAAAQSSATSTLARASASTATGDSAAAVARAPAGPAAPTPRSRQDWLRQVEHLEAQLQATLALGPDGAVGAVRAHGVVAAPAASGDMPMSVSMSTPAAEVVSRHPSAVTTTPAAMHQVPRLLGIPGHAAHVCRVAPPPTSAAATTGDATEGRGGDIQAGVQTFSVVTPSAPVPPPNLASTPAAAATTVLAAAVPVACAHAVHAARPAPRINLGRARVQAATVQ